MELYKNKCICIYIYTHKYRISCDFKLKFVTESRDCLVFLPLEDLLQSALKKVKLQTNEGAISLPENWAM